MAEDREQIGRVQVREDRDELVFRRKTASTVGLGFLICWLSVWTIACVALAVRVVREPTLITIIFAVPFSTAWFSGFSILAWTLFGFEELRHGPGGLDHRRGLLAWSRSRMLPFAEVRAVTDYARVVDSESGQVEHGLKIEAAGRPIRFGQGLDDDDLHSLADRLHDRLQALAPGRSIPLSLDVEHEEEGHAERIEKGATAEPPSDCGLQDMLEWDRVIVSRHGRIHLRSLSVALFLVLFWDGIVAVLLLDLRDKFEWGQFLFLIPFEVVGLGMFACLVVVLLAPFRLERWEAGAWGIARRASLFGIGRTTTHEASEVAAIELRRGDAKGSKKRSLAESMQVADEDAPYRLAVLDPSGHDLFTIRNLTEGEARWAGSVLGVVLPDGPARVASVPSELWDRELDVRV